MLLEQHKEAVLNLLADPKLLEEQVNFALKTLKEYVTSKCLQNKTTFADQFTHSFSRSHFTYFKPTHYSHPGPFASLIFEVKKSAFIEIF